MVNGVSAGGDGGGVTRVGRRGRSAAYVPVPQIVTYLSHSSPSRPPAHVTLCAAALLPLDLGEHVSGRFGLSASKVYKTLIAFKIKTGVKPFGSSKLEGVNEPPSCSYRQLMWFWEGFSAR